MALVKCIECGKEISDQAASCPTCGHRLQSLTNGRNRTTAILLTVFLGGIGIHKFYLGQKGKGILFLLFCWTFIPAIFALIDLVKFIIMDDAKFNNIYNT